VSKLDERDFRKALHKGRDFGVLVLFGNEYLIREAVRDYVAQLMPSDAAGFDLTDFRGQDVPAKDLWNSLITMPLLAKRRIVIADWCRPAAESAHAKRDESKTRTVPAGKSKAADDAVAIVVRECLERPSPTTSFVMVAPDFVKAKGKKTPFDDLPDQVAVVELAYPKSDALAKWISEYVSARGMRISGEATEYLLMNSTGSLSELAGRLDRAILYLGDEREVTADALQRVSGISSEYTVFKLEDAVLAGRPEEAHRIARSLLEGGDHLLQLLAFHRGEALKVWKVSRLMTQLPARASESDMIAVCAPGLGGQAFKAKDFVAAARRLGEQRIRTAIKGLLDIEIAAKTGSGEPHRYYEWLWQVSAGTQVR